MAIFFVPFLIKGAAVAAGLLGAGSAVHGVKKMKDAKDLSDDAKFRNNRNLARLEKENNTTLVEMDKLGKLELNILHGFKEFSDVFEKIKNRPSFKRFTLNGVTLPQYDGEKIKEVSVGAGVLLGGLGGVGLGAAGGFAAAGATTAAVMALGTASTGTAIASLSGVAATNATLAALGGGSIAAGGGGMVAGAAALSAATLGVGLLVGGVIFNFTGSKMAEKAEEAMDQVIQAERKINMICHYLTELREITEKYYKTLSAVNTTYQNHFQKLKQIASKRYYDWNNFTHQEKKITENTVLLVGLLYKMCQLKLVIKSNNENDINTINKAEIQKTRDEAKQISLAIKASYEAR